jgi:hypothetical protein
MMVCATIVAMQYKPALGQAMCFTIHGSGLCKGLCKVGTPPEDGGKAGGMHAKEAELNPSVWWNQGDMSRYANNNISLYQMVHLYTRLTEQRFPQKGVRF